MTVLTDHFFIHSIVPKNYFVSTPVTDVTDHEQDPFVYITTECYIFKEFYGVMIDTGASKKSTVDYR